MKIDKFKLQRLNKEIDDLRESFIEFLNEKGNCSKYAGMLGTTRGQLHRYKNGTRIIKTDTLLEYLNKLL